MSELQVIEIFGQMDDAGHITSIIVDGTTQDHSQTNLTVDHTACSTSTPSTKLTANETGHWRATFENVNDEGNVVVLGAIKPDSDSAKVVLYNKNEQTIAIIDEATDEVEEFNLLEDNALEVIEEPIH